MKIAACEANPFRISGLKIKEAFTTVGGVFYIDAAGINILIENCEAENIKTP